MSDIAESLVQLYDAKTIDSLEWPETEDASYAKRFLEPMVKNGIPAYIDNIQTDVFALKVADHVLPVMVATENYENSYICSPYGHYISLGQQSTQLIGNPFFAKIVQKLVGGLGLGVRAGRINSVVYVNHWLAALDLYPGGFTTENLLAITAFLKERFPEHAIIFRSLTPVTNASLILSLVNLDYDLLASRYVFFTDTKNDAVFTTRILKSDLKLWRDSPYKICDESQISPDEFPQLLELYNRLYLDRPNLQPRYNQRYIQMLFEQRLLHFKS